MQTKKFPRIPHLPWSPGGTSEDKRLVCADGLINRTIVISEKLDGSNVCFTRRSVFARSHTGPPKHRSFDLLKRLHAGLAHSLPPDVSVFGEWLYAVHSIEYSALPSYLYLFSVRDDPKKRWWSWGDVGQLAQELGVLRVPELWVGQVSSETMLQETVMCCAREPSCYGPFREGVVIRWADGFADGDFTSAVAKWVRVGHVQSEDHWLTQPIRRQPLGGRH